MEGVDGTALSLKLSYRLIAKGFHPNFAQGLGEVREETGIELSCLQDQHVVQSRLNRPLEKRLPAGLDARVADPSSHRNLSLRERLWNVDRRSGGED